MFLNLKAVTHTYINTQQNTFTNFCVAYIYVAQLLYFKYFDLELHLVPFYSNSLTFSHNILDNKGKFHNDSSETSGFPEIIILVFVQNLTD